METSVLYISRVVGCVGSGLSGSGAISGLTTGSGFFSTVLGTRFFVEGEYPLDFSGIAPLVKERILYFLFSAGAPVKQKKKKETEHKPQETLLIVSSAHQKIYHGYFHPLVGWQVLPAGKLFVVHLTVDR